MLKFILSGLLLWACCCHAVMKSKKYLIKGAKNQKLISENAKTVKCRDFFGKENTLNKRPKRVIIGYTSMVSMWYLAGGRAVAIPTNRAMLNKNLPKEAQTLPRIGSFSHLNIEKIISLKPELVILSAFSGGSSSTGAAALLKSTGIETLSVYYGNYAGFLEILDIFCSINGTCLQKNEKVKKIIKQVDNICKKTAKFRSPRFLSIFYSGHGLSVELNKANTAQIAMMLNATNIVQKFGKSIGGSRIPFSMEKLVMEDPDIILVTTMGNSKKLKARLKKNLMTSPVWNSMRAVKKGNVHFLPNNLFLYKANERYGQSFRYMAKLLYPEEKLDSKQ